VLGEAGGGLDDPGMATGRELTVTLALCGTVGWIQAQDLKAAPMWQQVSELSLRVGHKDNVTLSNAGAEASPFVGAELDGMVWRGLGENGQFEGFLLGEHRQYLDAEQVEKEQTLYGLLQMRQEWGEDWRAGAGFEYFYQDQVIDLAATEVEVEPARIQGHTFTGRARAKRGLGGGWLELELGGTRQLFAEVIDDYWELAPRLEWTWPVQAGSELSLGYQFAYDWYDRDPALTVEGEPIPGTRREMGRHEVVFAGRQYFGKDRRWRVTLRLSGRINRDNASGYYDYVRPQASVRLRYQWAEWEVEGGLRLNHYHYREQTVAEGDTELRRRSEVYGDLRVQRRLGGRFRIFVEYDYEQTFSNRGVEEYAVNTVSGGMGFEF
jgi:hypothetical protein